MNDLIKKHREEYEKSKSLGWKKLKLARKLEEETHVTPEMMRHESSYYFQKMELHEELVKYLEELKETHVLLTIEEYKQLKKF